MLVLAWRITFYLLGANIILTYFSHARDTHRIPPIGRMNIWTILTHTKVNWFHTLWHDDILSCLHPPHHRPRDHFTLRRAYRRWSTNRPGQIAWNHGMVLHYEQASFFMELSSYMVSPCDYTLFLSWRRQSFWIMQINNYMLISVSVIDRPRVSLWRQSMTSYQILHLAFMWKKIILRLISAQ